MKPLQLNDPIALYALRYTFGRQTYCAGEVYEWLAHEWHGIHQGVRKIIIKETKAHLDEPNADNINRPYYEAILELEGK